MQKNRFNGVVVPLLGVLIMSGFSLYAIQIIDKLEQENARLEQRLDSVRKDALAATECCIRASAQPTTPLSPEKKAENLRARQQIMDTAVHSARGCDGCPIKTEDNPDRAP